MTSKSSSENIIRCQPQKQITFSEVKAFGLKWTITWDTDVGKPLSIASTISEDNEFLTRDALDPYIKELKKADISGEATHIATDHWCISLHPAPENLKKFVQKFNAQMPKKETEIDGSTIYFPQNPKQSHADKVREGRADKGSEAFLG